ncbi:alcohol oxidase [Fomitiporia mediterranea MF3/22]|uniref:alcohol oxidase n=1 Tax=Fomitiporia mediterranea (strain MF3/22) TaxID=694068 RepID=UPI000440762C|nr:alcohol oxidase [Fomitiporia mediterranea MF3/22]EJC99664.1 alcohol oxidase [Fomitiporia mediterranea MF3/22]
MPFVSAEDLGSVKPDYIIVGGGTVGLVLAARLTEDPSVTVLVIEAGSYHGSVPEIDVPGLLGRTIANPKYDWTFFSVPQKHLNDRVVLQPRGKGLGGSSLIHFNTDTRPSKAELDALQELGNEGWNWESFLHYVKKSETVYPPSGITAEQAKVYAATLEPEFHGTNGPIYKSMRTVWTDAHAKVFDAAEALGIPRNPEPGNGVNTGAMTAFSSVDPRTATRSSAATAYLKPNLGRNNFLVLADTQVTKVLLSWDGSLQKAIGVEIIKNGVTSRIEGVKKDVIISCGSLQTPQILELSGIGNPEILSQHNIPCAIDLPGVGENLQDHVSVYTIAEIEHTDETFDILGEPTLLKEQEELYKQQRGHLSYGPAPAYIFVPAKKLGAIDKIISWENHAHAKLTESLARVVPSLKAGLEKQYKIQEKFIVDENQAQAELLQFIGHPMLPYAIATPGKRYTALVGALMHPLSRGAVHITSSDPLAAPAIDPNYLANEVDLDMIVHIVRFLERMYKTPPLANIVKEQVLPAPNVLKDENKLREFIKDTCGPVFHPVGTAAMLPREDGGVVDKDLKVYGTSNLRVIDMSIMPLELSCHTQTVAYAIGEKAADILKADFFRK